MHFYVCQIPLSDQKGRNQIEYLQPTATSLLVSHADTQRQETKLVRSANQSSVTVAGHTHLGISAPLPRQQHKGPTTSQTSSSLAVENAVDSNNKTLQQLFTRAPLCESMSVSVFSATATMVQRKKRGQSSRRHNSTADAKWNYSSPKPCLATGQKMKRTPKHTRRVTFDVGGDARGRAAGATNISVRASIDSSSSSSSPTNSYCSCCESSDLSSVTTSFSSSASSSSESLSSTESTSLETAFRMYGLHQVPPTFKHLSEFSPSPSS
nr:unnamed protein product [Spirometra erinaceieuropaei]